MALVLSQASSFNSGSDLWICPDEKNSTWFAKFDWYLNFRFSKFELKSTHRVSPYFENIIEQCELPTFQSSTVDHLMVSSQLNLPARWVVSIKFDSHSPKNWVQQALGVHKNLGQPTLRVFLPQNFEPHQFESYWNEIGGIGEYSVVADTTSI